MDAPQVTVIIPTYNRLARLRRVLQALERQTLDPGRFEVIVVSDGSTDGTDDFLRTIETPFRLVASFQDNGGPAAARNRGLELARGAIVLFIDDDVVAQDELLEQHLASHATTPSSIVVIGPMLTPSDHRTGPFVAWEQTMLYKQYEAMTNGEYEPTFRQFYTGNASVPRDLLNAAGAFDERFRRAEDVELAYRLAGLGARFVFNDQAIGYHYATRSCRAWLGIAYDYGVNDVELGRRQTVSFAFETIRREFASRHGFIRALSRLCVGRPMIRAVLRGPMQAVGSSSYRLGLRGPGRMALSALYHLTYYDGLACELGGRDEFLRLVTRHRFPRWVDEPDEGPHAEMSERQNGSSEP